MVIGSLPRPRWVQEVISDRTHRRISQRDADRLLDDAVLSAIRLQERAGLDYISDGEWRRENYARVFADKVGGFKRQRVEKGRLILLAFVVDKLERIGPIASADAEFLRSRTDRKTLVTLPGPCTIGDLMWHPEYSAQVYPTHQEFVKACVPILRDEVVALSRLGVDAIQLDEPLLPRLVSPEGYYMKSRAEVEAAVELSVETINQVADGINDVFLSVHLCHGYNSGRTSAIDTEGLMATAVKRYRVDRIAMEFNSPGANRLQSLRDFPKGPILGLGVINPKGDESESSEIVVQRAERALDFVEKERIVLNPDCGFSTSVGSPRNLDDAYTKLKTMCHAAQVLREQYS